MLVELRAGGPGSATPIDLEKLRYIAFSGQQELAHGLFRSIPVERREEFADKYILSEVIAGGVKKLRKFLSVSAEEAALEEKEFIDETARLFLKTCRRSGVFPRELFEGLLQWSAELAGLSLLQESTFYYEEVLQAGVNKYPDLFARAVMGKATVLAMTGNCREAQEHLISLADRPYLLSDRNIIPDLMFNLGRESLLTGDIVYYKNVLFRGLRHFYATMKDREMFVDQIRRTYRYSYRVLIDRRIRFSDRFLFLLHRAYFKVQDVKLLRVSHVASLAKTMLLGYVYWLNYVGRSDVRYSGTGPQLIPNASTARTELHRETDTRKSILITRAMGGIGDLLMMTPGLHALKNKHPRQTIFLAVPRRYFPLFEGNSDISLLDIENDTIHFPAYRRWYNFSDCPAARVESRTAPRVKRNRIDIFATAMGVGMLRAKLMDHRPRYFVSEHERAYREEFWKQRGLHGRLVIGVQLRSDEVYRDYPHMLQLVQALSRFSHVLAFGNEDQSGAVDGDVTWVSGLPLRKAFALAAGCNVIVAPDSAFLHFAAALEIPCVGLFGPIDGRVRTSHYPLCKPIDVRKKLGCLPCWRNERIPCKLTDMRSSVCMNDIGINEVIESVNHILGKKRQQ